MEKNLKKNICVHVYIHTHKYSYVKLNHFIAHSKLNIVKELNLNIFFSDAKSFLEMKSFLTF